MKYEVVLCECTGVRGLNKAIVAKMADMLNEDEFYPVIFDADYTEASAMGFISRTTAEKLKFDYYELKAYIGGILDEDHEKIYEIDGVKIFIGDDREDEEE
jgi:hypothetical protein